MMYKYMYKDVINERIRMDSLGVWMKKQVNVQAGVYSVVFFQHQEHLKPLQNYTYIYIYMYNITSLVYDFKPVDTWVLLSSVVWWVCSVLIGPYLYGPLCTGNLLFNDHTSLFRYYSYYIYVTRNIYLTHFV